MKLIVLPDNQIGAEGAKSIAVALEKNEAVTNINLNSKLLIVCVKNWSMIVIQTTELTLRERNLLPRHLKRTIH
jgi:hypothetical protein